MSIGNSVQAAVEGTAAIVGHGLDAAGHVTHGAAEFSKCTAEPVAKASADFIKDTAEPTGGILSAPFHMARDFVAAPLVRLGKTFRRAVEAGLDTVDGYLPQPAPVPVLIPVRR